jgi:hypothetical protein
MPISDDTFQRVTKAKSSQVEAATEIWNARLDILRSSGDIQGVLNHLRTPVELAGDNCGCNSACGSTPALSDLSSRPATRT